MRILFDYQTFSEQTTGGASRYFFELYKRLSHYPDVEAQCSVLLSVNEYLNGSGLARFRVKPTGFPLKRKAITAINLLASHYSLWQNTFDVFHPTYYRPYYVNSRTTKPIVLTCLDMIHEKFVTTDRRTIENKRKTLSRATKIVAISQNTKNDLVEIYKIPESKVLVSHLASSLEVPPNVGAKITDHPYFLFVGMRHSYKNFTPFVRAIAPLLRTSGLELVCVGGGKFSKQEIALFRTLKVEDRLRQQTASDAALAELYAGATAFFYPSHYEGFGIPILEAMSCGCPVAASNSSSMPEVGGNAALYFDPADLGSIHRAAEVLLQTPELRNDLIKKGFVRVKEFSWDKTTSQHYDLYKTLVKG